jgi:GTPase SAR1 family protein
MLASSKKAVADAAVMRRALEEGAKSWNRSKVMLVGQWEAGKTYLADAMMGNEFSDNTRTRGINKFSLDVNFAQVDAGVWKVNTSQHQGNHHLEHAVAELIRVKKKQNISAPARKVVKADGVPMAAENSIFTSLLSYFRFFGQSESSASAAATTGMVSSISLQPHQVDRVSKLLSSNTRMGDIVVALYDFGGQEIFSSIYPLFFTRNAVYLVVFDLCKLTSFFSSNSKKQASAQKASRFCDFLLICETAKRESIDVGRTSLCTTHVRALFPQASLNQQRQHAVPDTQYSVLTKLGSSCGGRVFGFRAQTERVFHRERNDRNGFVSSLIPDSIIYIYMLWVTWQATIPVYWR